MQRSSRFSVFSLIVFTTSRTNESEEQGARRDESSLSFSVLGDIGSPGKGKYSFDILLESLSFYSPI